MPEEQQSQNMNAGGQNWLGNAAPKPQGGLQAAPQQDLFGSMANMWNPTTPQGFTQWAGMLRPVTESVLQYGGFPAMMALYGLFTGNQNFSRGFTKTPQLPQQSQFAPAPSSLLNYPKMGSVRLPLPVSVDGDLEMPDLKKEAAGPWGQGIPTSHSPGVWGPGLDAMRANPWGRVPAARNFEYQPDAVQFTGQGEDGSTGQDAPGSTRGQLVKELGKNLAIYEAERRGLHTGAKEVAKRTLPKLGLKATTKAVPGGVVMDTPINIVNNTADLLGLPAPLGGSTKENYVYQKPVIDPATGKPKTGPDGSPEWEYGFNPSAMGRDWNEWQQMTTPDGTFMGGRRTGDPVLDHSLSYLGSAWNAYHEPVTSAADMAKFQYYDMNPLRDLNLLWNRQARTEGPKSIPLIFAHEMVSGSDAPEDRYLPGGKAFSQTKEMYNRGTGGDRFNRFFNPGGTTGPELPHAKHWLESPIQQTKNWAASVGEKGLLPTMEQAWLKNW